jgi:succinyl-CoA---D-citramalate CoA-transferase
LGELARDERFTDGFRRQQNADALDEIMAAWFRKHDFAEALRILDAGEVVSGPIYTIEDIFNDPQYNAREDIVAVPDPDFGTVRMQSATPIFSRTPGKVRHPGKKLGEDNEEVYRGELGLSAAELERLKAKKII